MTEFTDVAASAQVPDAPRLAQPFLNIPVDISRHPSLGQTAKLVYGILNRLHKINAKRGKDTFRVSQERIAHQIGRSVRTVKRAIRQLRGNLDGQGVPQFDPLIVVISTGHCNYYRLLPLQEAQKDNVDNSPDLVQNPEVRGDISAPRIEGVGGMGTENTEVPSYALEAQGHQLLDSEVGKRLVRRLRLLCYDWTVENPELSPLHQRNRQRQNRRDVAIFVGQYGLEGLLFAVERCERTSLDDGAGVFRRMITGGLFPSETHKIRQLYEDAA